METGNTGKSPNFQRELAVRTLVLYAVKLISLEQVDSLMKEYRNSFDRSFRASVRAHFCLCFPLCIVCKDFARRISQSGEVSFNPVANRECEIQSALQSGWKLVSAEYRGVFVVSSTSHIRERSGPPRSLFVIVAPLRKPGVSHVLANLFMVTRYVGTKHTTVAEYARNIYDRKDERKFKTDLRFSLYDENVSVKNIST